VDPTECIQRVCEAARMGVCTGLIVGDKSGRQTAAAVLALMAADAKTASKESVLIWSFRESGGELILASNAGAARTAFLRMRRGAEPLEIVYLGRDSV